MGQSFYIFHKLRHASIFTCSNRPGFYKVIQSWWERGRSFQKFLQIFLTGCKKVFTSHSVESSLRQKKELPRNSRANKTFKYSEVADQRCS